LINDIEGGLRRERRGERREERGERREERGSVRMLLHHPSNSRLEASRGK
jgi:hypothetical protein